MFSQKNHKALIIKNNNNKVLCQIRRDFFFLCFFFHISIFSGPVCNLTSPNTFGGSGFTVSIGVGPETSHTVAHTAIASSPSYEGFCNVCVRARAPAPAHAHGQPHSLFKHSPFILCKRAAGSCPPSPRDEVQCLCALDFHPTARALPFHAH